MNEQLIDRLAQGKPGLARRVLDAIRDVLARLKRTLRRSEVEPLEQALRDTIRAVVAKLTGAEKKAAQTAEGKLTAALEAASKQAEKLGENKNTAQEGGETRFSIRSAAGKDVVWIENSSLSNKELNDHRAVAACIAQHIGEVYTIIESGQKVYIGNELPGEYTQSKYTSYLRKTDRSGARAKNKAVDGLGELIETATNRRWEPTKHNRSKDAAYGMYRYDSTVAFPVKDSRGMVQRVRAYDVELLIRNASDGKKYLYDIINVKENTSAQIDLANREARSAAHQTATGGSASRNNVHRTTGNVNAKFSLKAPVEETKNLVALHNLTSEKLEKVLKLGGFPMPSIAVTKSDIPHTNFGDITLVMDKSAVDPKANKKNTVYSADAWTPTVPVTEYEVNSVVEKKVQRTLGELSEKVDTYFQDDLKRIRYGLEEYLNREGGEEGVVQRVLDSYGLKAAYLESQGRHVENATTQKETDPGYSPERAEKYLAVQKALGGMSAEEIGKAPMKELRDRYGQALEEAFPGMTKSALRMSSVLRQTQNYLNRQTDGPTYEMVTDIAATKKAVDDALDMGAYEMWVRELFAGIEGDSGVYNNKELYTPNGNRRTFKQTHYPATLEGITKAMTEQNGGNSKNVAGFHGVKTLRAGMAERFKSIADIHKLEGRLQGLTQEQIDEIHENLIDRLAQGKPSLARRVLDAIRDVLAQLKRTLRRSEVEPLEQAARLWEQALRDANRAYWQEGQRTESGEVRSSIRETALTEEAGHDRMEETTRQEDDHYGNKEGRAVSEIAGVDPKSRTENGDRPGVQKTVRGVQQSDRQGVRLDEELQTRGLIEKSAAEYQVPLEFVKAESWPTGHEAHAAYSSKGKIYIREGVDPSTAAEIVPHEGTHIMKQTGFQPYMDLLEKTSDMMDWENKDAQKLLRAAAEHRGIDLFSMSGTDMTTLYDEINAIVSGGIMSGQDAQIREQLENAFYDYDLYRDEVERIHREFQRRSESRSTGETGTQTEKKSVKGTRALQKQVEALTRQNQRLKEQMKRTDTVKASRKAVEQRAGEIRKAYQSRIDKAALADRIDSYGWKKENPWGENTVKNAADRECSTAFFCY